MTLADLIAPETTDGHPVYELVTLPPEQLTSGLCTGNALPFPDLASAVQYARQSLSADEREISWIRTPNGVLKLSDAEGRLAGSHRPDESEPAGPA